MNYRQFVQLFPEQSEIGRDITDTECTSYHDNGNVVGCWRVNRRDTTGKGEVLSFADAEIARAFFRTISQLQSEKYR